MKLTWKTVWLNVYTALTDTGRYEVAEQQDRTWVARRNGRIIHRAGRADLAKRQAQIDHDDRARKAARKAQRLENGK